jgi:fatty-acyl-CoA synthase
MILASDWVAFHADRTPEKWAFTDQFTNRILSYGELQERVDYLAGYLRRHWRIEAGDVIAILAKNSVEFFEFHFACVRLGAVMPPLSWRLAEPELLFILNDSGAKGLVYDSEFTERTPPLVEGSTVDHCLRIDVVGSVDDGYPSFEEAIDEVISGGVMNPQTTHDTPMTIMYTSGTTGHPKGVIITHGMTLWNAINISTPSGLNHDSVQYVVLPLFHTGGLNLYANPLIHCGGSVIVAREYDPGLTLKTISDSDQHVTHFFGVPSIYLFLSQHEDFDATDLSRIHSWGCGGAPMPVALLEKYARRDIIIQLGFGMTETSPTVFLIDKKRAIKKPSSVGKPLLHTRVRVVNDRLEDVPIGEVGEVVISGPNITPGYHNRPQATQENFSFDEHGNRWLHSGDAGMIDEEGCIYIVDRYKDMYISGGENVYPAEVEQVIFKIEGVADAAVIGVPDERWGESGMAIVVCGQGKSLDERGIIEYCQQNLARFKVPKSVAFIDELPRNAAGKVLKRTLKEQFKHVKL